MSTDWRIQTWVNGPGLNPDRALRLGTFGRPSSDRPGPGPRPGAGNWAHLFFHIISLIYIKLDMFIVVQWWLIVLMKSLKEAGCFQTRPELLGFIGSSSTLISMLAASQCFLQYSDDSWYQYATISAVIFDHMFDHLRLDNDSFINPKSLSLELLMMIFLGDDDPERLCSNSLSFLGFKRDQNRGKKWPALLVLQ